MISGFVSGLIAAWILSWFHVNRMLIEVAQPFLSNVELTNAHYYIAFGVVGLIGGAFTRTVTVHKN